VFILKRLYLIKNKVADKQFLIFWREIKANSNLKKDRITKINTIYFCVNNFKLKTKVSKTGDKES